ncbi:hypothetical protein SAMN05216548_11452 [Faunimonas pinastri]|uniref:Uncharacterized protein n=1 Tax=Faunimonas pinastri TaxID=1855383 RepID=A0A1H9MU83_9HYPH|nr:hypothetical protein [Faunimonas pinastri]SER27254.1 hypothetical protein SAMN05216548_11452 [Faunimonas pinastri]
MVTESSLVSFGFASGGYWCRCGTCAEPFEGDKRAFRCKPCAQKAKVATEKAVELQELVAFMYVEAAGERVISQGHALKAFNFFVRNIEDISHLLPKATRA